MVAFKPGVWLYAANGSYAIQYICESLYRMGADAMANAIDRNQFWNLAAVAFQAGKFELARDYFARFVLLNEGSAITSSDVQALRNMGVCCKKLGRLDEAIQYYTKSLAHARDLDLLAEQADNISNLGIIYKNQGLQLLSEGRPDDARKRWEAAEAMYLEARDLDWRLNNSDGVALDLLNLGIIYNHLGHRSRAIGAFEECIRLATGTGNVTTLAKARGGIGSVYASIQEWPKAIEHYAEAVSILSRSATEDAPWSIAIARTNLGIARFHSGDREAARRELTQAADLFRYMNVNDGTARAVQEYLRRLDHATE